MCVSQLKSTRPMYYKSGGTFVIALLASLCSLSSYSNGRVLAPVSAAVVESDVFLDESVQLVREKGKADGMVVSAVALSHASADLLKDIITKHRTLRMLFLSEFGDANDIVGQIRDSEISSLTLDRSPLSAEGFAEIAKSKKLVDLSLVGPVSIDAPSFKQIGHMPNLKLLALSQLTLDGEGLNSISRSKSLESLQLDNCKVGAKQIASLRECRSIKVLGLTGSAITDDCLSSVIDLPVLQELSLDDSSVTRTGVELLLSRKKLKVLSIANTKVSDAAIIELRKSYPATEIKGRKMTDTSKDER